MGQIQTLGKVSRAELEGSEAVYAPLDLDFVARHSVDWWLTSEDLPDPNNRIRVDREGRIVVEYTENNGEAFDRLMNRSERSAERDRVRVSLVAEWGATLMRAASPRSRTNWERRAWGTKWGPAVSARTPPRVSSRPELQGSRLGQLVCR